MMKVPRSASRDPSEMSQKSEDNDFNQNNLYQPEYTVVSNFT